MPQKDPITTGPSSGARIRGFVYYAFLISLAIHFLAGPLLPRFEQRHETEKVEKVSVEKKIKVVVKQTPPPTPPPTPTPPPQKSTPPPVKSTPAPQQPKLKINQVKTQNDTASGPTEKTQDTTQGSTEGVPKGTVASAPAAPPATAAPPPPTPTPKPACANPNVDPRTITADTPDTPEMARQQGATGVAQVKVSLSPSGKETSGGASVITGASIFKSAGNPALDQAAVASAKRSTFSTKVVNCEPQADSYIFRVEFQ